MSSVPGNRLSAPRPTAPHREVILTDPTYAGMINRVRLAGGVPAFVPLTVSDGRWRLPPDRLAEAVTDRTRAMLLMSQSMPSGHVFSDAEWRAVAEACERSDCWRR